MMTIFDIIADPTRRQILDLLLQRPHTVNELVGAVEISQPGISKQLRILREAGLVDVQQEAQMRWYELRPEPLQEIDKWLSAYRQMWSSRYERLDEYLKQVQEEDKHHGDE